MTAVVGFPALSGGAWITDGYLEANEDFNYKIGDIGAAIASGSFRTMGMIVAPCSTRTVAEIASGASSMRHDLAVECNSACRFTHDRRPGWTPPAMQNICNSVEISHRVGSRLGAEKDQSSEPNHSRDQAIDLGEQITHIVV